MPSVLIPRSVSGGGGQMFGRILPAVGSLFGPIGSAVGGALGGIIGGSSEGQEKRTAQIADMPQDVKRAEIPEAPDPDAMSRRASQLESDPYEQLMRAHRALQDGPKELREEYGSQLDEALRIAQRQRSMA